MLRILSVTWIGIASFITTLPAILLLVVPLVFLTILAGCLIQSPRKKLLWLSLGLALAPILLHLAPVVIAAINIA